MRAAVREKLLCADRLELMRIYHRRVRRSSRCVAAARVNGGGGGGGGGA